MADNSFWKKGDLEITLLEGRGLKNGHSAHVFCVVKMKMNKSFKTTTAKAPDPKWNQSVTMDLMSLNEELFIKVMEQKTLGSPQFLGQVQIPIKALQLQSEPEWYFLSDAPSDNPKSKRASIVITGEVKVRLVFIHRLKRAQSTLLPAKSPDPDPATPMTVASPSEASPNPSGESTPPLSAHNLQPPSPLDPFTKSSKKENRKSVSSIDAEKLASMWGGKSGPANGNRGVSSVAALESPPRQPRSVSPIAPSPLTTTVTPIPAKSTRSTSPRATSPTRAISPRSTSPPSMAHTPVANGSTKPLPQQPRPAVTQPPLLQPQPQFLQPQPQAYAKPEGLTRHRSTMLRNTLESDTAPETNQPRGLVSSQSQVSFLPVSTYKKLRVAKGERVMIEEALKEKQMEVEKKIKQGRELIHTMSMRVQKNDGNADVMKKQIEAMEQNLRQMEDAYAKEKIERQAESGKQALSSELKRVPAVDFKKVEFSEDTKKTPRDARDRSDSNSELPRADGEQGAPHRVESVRSSDNLREGANTEQFSINKRTR